MKHITITGLTGLISLMGLVPTTFASIYIAAYTPPAPPKGIYTAKITSVLIGQAHKEDSDTVLPGKHSIYVKINNPMKGNLVLGFTGEDVPNGLAFMHMIGKTVNIAIDRDEKNKLIVQNIEFHEN